MGLQHRQAKALVEGRKSKKECAAQQPRQRFVGHIPGKVNPIPQPQRLGLAGKGFAQPAQPPGDHQIPAHPFPRHQPGVGVHQPGQILAGLKGAHVESVVRKLSCLQKLSLREGISRLVDHLHFRRRCAVEAGQIVRGGLAGRDNPSGRPTAPAGGKLQIAPLAGGVGRGEVAIAHVVQGDHRGGQQPRRRKGDDVGRHKQHIRAAAYHLPGQGRVGPQPAARQIAHFDFWASLWVGCIHQ